jgi:hypothetical protein
VYAVNAESAFRFKRPEQFVGAGAAKVGSGYKSDVQTHPVLGGDKIADVTHDAAERSAKTVNDPAWHAAAQNQRSRT